MENLVMQSNDKWPIIDFNAKSGNLSISGKSIPSDVLSVYTPIVSWLKEYAKAPANKTVMSVNLQYYNTASSKYLLDIFKILDKLFQEGHSVVINWVWELEDDDFREEGEMYKSMLELPFLLKNS